MRVKSINPVAVVSLVLAGVSSAAHALPIPMNYETVDLETTTPPAPTRFTPTGPVTDSFTALGNGATPGDYTFIVGPGQGQLGDASSASDLCSGLSATECATNGTNSLYMFHSNDFAGAAEVMLQPSAPAGTVMLSIDSFFAAIAAISPSCLFDFDPNDNVCDIPSGLTSNPAAIRVTGRRNAFVGGLDPLPVDIFLDPLNPLVGEGFSQQLLADFIDLDWVKFTDYSTQNSLCNGACIDAFALDDFHVSLDPIPAPTGVPEPASFALFGFGFLVLAYMRRRGRAETE